MMTMTFSRFSLLFALVALVATVTVTPSAAFAPSKASSLMTRTQTRSFTVDPVNAFGKKKQQEDLSDIETRDMTREEMLELNAKNEDIMNMELGAMTGFSIVISLPIFYLCWVAFFRINLCIIKQGISSTSYTSHRRRDFFKLLYSLARIMTAALVRGRIFYLLRTTTGLGVLSF